MESIHVLIVSQRYCHRKGNAIIIQYSYIKVILYCTHVNGWWFVQPSKNCLIDLSVDIMAFIWYINACHIAAIVNEENSKFWKNFFWSLWSQFTVIQNEFILRWWYIHFIKKLTIIFLSLLKSDWRNFFKFRFYAIYIFSTLFKQQQNPSICIACEFNGWALYRKNDRDLELEW